MLERCPLSDSQKFVAAGETPDICRERCDQLMNDDIRGTGTYELLIPLGEAIPNVELQFSHISIVRTSLNRGFNRTYSVTDKVGDENGFTDISRTTWNFNCPYA